MIFCFNINSVIEMDVFFYFATSRLVSCRLKLKSSTFMLFQRMVGFLADGIETNPENIEAVATWPVPEGICDFRSFIGLRSYYRRLVGFAEVAAPLHALTGKYARFEWYEECQFAFEKLKKALTTPPSSPFQRLIDVIMSGLNLEVCLVYLDDIIAYAADLGTNFNRMRAVFERLQAAGLKK